ncbi:MAG TPA: extracellular solute-binding protein, partial [Bacillaceae bacterium]
KWDEALEAANQLMVDDEENRTCGLYFHPLSVNRWPIFLLQNRIEFSYDPSGSVEFPVTGLIESVNFIKKLFDEQGILQTFLSDSDRDAEQLFLEQKVSMIVTSYFSLNEIKDHSIPYDIAPLPYLKDAQTLLLIIGLAINKNSMKKEAAKRFVDFMADEAAQETIRKETLSIPAMKKIAEKQGKSLVQKPSRYHLFRETIPTFRLYSDLGLTSRELSELRNELRIYLSDLMDDKIFLQRVTAKLSELNINTHV